MSVNFDSAEKIAACFTELAAKFFESDSAVETVASGILLFVVANIPRKEVEEAYDAQEIFDLIRSGKLPNSRS